MRVKAIIAKCYKCKKEHDITHNKIEELKCSCGGHIITPTLKMMIRVIPEGGGNSLEFNKK